ncbi:GAF domain-containing sensor histidine kinase [Stigmatella sp. ncwal1]|uniref:histidine kinase n=1 Tax=Stigmatella ashevillensis TaxID=2995309 RepID=A0ABT5DDH9_9BACT|nr:GAF domain-containing sensor histidine kinase [Stigmatella ashevillena]MDC0710401.1 GAF domain-containing sensor histidine kinase [Stigmatella ashevillena]
MGESLNVQSLLRSQARLEALRQTGLMDSPAEEAFDRLTRLACHGLHTPMGMVNFLDEGRLFCKSCHGLPESWLRQREMPVSHSVCLHTMAAGAPLLVEDIRKHPLLRECLAMETLGAIAYAGVPLVNSGGHALGTLCVLDTVSRRWTDREANILKEFAACVMTEVELREVRECERLLQKEREAVNSRDEFLSIAAHELRTPLTPLKLQLETLRRSVVAAGVDDPRVLRHLERSTAQVQRLTQLVDRLLDVSRIATGRLGLLLEDMDLSELATEVTDRFQEEAEAAGCPLEAHTPDRVRGVWDRLRLEQVLSSLISNAIKYGAGHPIDVSVEGQEGVARLCVQDQGIGLVPEDASRIFERFERAVSPKHYGGMGLGLYVARQIIEAHGGTIVVRSQPGKGSLFIVVLPMDSQPRRPSSREESHVASRG